MVDFCCLRITFGKKLCFKVHWVGLQYVIVEFPGQIHFLDPDQEQPNVWPDLDPNPLIVLLKELFYNDNLKKKKTADVKKLSKVTGHAKS